MTIRSVAITIVSFAALTGALAAQQAPAAANDPRIGLKAGIEDAGTAARGIELIGHLPRPEGFVDPSGHGSLDYANSDFAFQRNMLFLGNFHGFNFYDVEDPRKPALRVSVPCPGGQGDLSVYKNLLFMSVEQGSGRVDCGAQGVKDLVSSERFRGVRIFDITDMKSPKQIAAVQTCRGSHTHTLVVDPKDKDNIYIYGSGISGVRSAQELEGCNSAPDEPTTSLFSIDVIQVPLAAPQTAKVVNRPRIFADVATGTVGAVISAPGHGETPAAPTTPGRPSNQCHDITVYASIGLAAGACSGNGILLDISDPVHPVRLDAVSDERFAYWHSATFNNDGTKVLFSDEWGGGVNPRCRASDPLNWGADAIFDIVNRKMKFAGYYKMPAPQTDIENCVAHNGSLIPVPGRDIMVQAWYQGGLSVFDFTDSAHPVEIAFFDRGPYDASKLVIAGYWSTYWYNGHIFGSEIGRGLDILELKPTELLTKNELDAAKLVKFDELNVQAQPHYTWPASFTVARAYIDQLKRSKGLSAERAAALDAAMDKKDAKQLSQLAKELDTSADTAGSNAAKLRTLASTIRVAAAAK